MQNVKGIKKITWKNMPRKLDILLNKESGTSTKSFLQVMGRFMGEKGTKVIIPLIQENDNTFAYTDSEKAGKLNFYFASIRIIGLQSQTRFFNQ